MGHLPALEGAVLAGRPGDVLGRRRSLAVTRAVQITRFAGPEVMDVVDLPDPVPGDGVG